MLRSAAQPGRRAVPCACHEQGRGGACARAGGSLRHVMPAGLASQATRGVQAGIRYGPGPPRPHGRPRAGGHLRHDGPPGARGLPAGGQDPAEPGAPQHHQVLQLVHPGQAPTRLPACQAALQPAPWLRSASPYAQAPQLAPAPFLRTCAPHSLRTMSSSSSWSGQSRATWGGRSKRARTRGSCSRRRTCTRSSPRCGVRPAVGGRYARPAAGSRVPGCLVACSRAHGRVCLLLPPPRRSAAP